MASMKEHRGRADKWTTSKSGFNSSEMSLGFRSKPEYSREQAIADFEEYLNHALYVPYSPQPSLHDYVATKRVMYDVLDRYHQVDPQQVGVINFLIEQEHEKAGADKYEIEKMRDGFGQENKMQLTSSDFGTAIAVFESLPKNQELSESGRGVIKKALENRKAVLEAPINVKPAPAIGSVRKEPPLFKRRTKDTSDPGPL